ncbi:hypothetical protein ZIOFF_018384 [Zingiber officinale]|uniref:Uncharacterized protein n=1 Tax=Zingiber officinale TaxID=94328 RepID=A0A8J5HGC4_ZINOF|nr:hypothetical protein ZIOFF_018384 [Zingiber officinale]
MERGKKNSLIYKRDTTFGGIVMPLSMGMSLFFSLKEAQPYISNLTKPFHSPPLRSPFRSPPSRSQREAQSPNFCGDKVFPVSRASRRLAFLKIGAKPQPSSPPSRSQTRSQALTSSAATSPNCLLILLPSPFQGIEAHQVIAARSSDFEFRHGKFTCSFGRFLINVGEESVMEEGKINSSEIKDKNNHVDQDPSTSIVNEVKLPEIGMTFPSEEEVRIFYNSYAQNVGFGICKLVEAGGYENLAFDERKCRNYVSEARRLRYVIKVLIRMKVIEVPKNYIIDRWRKDIKRGYQSISNIYDDYGCGGERLRYNILTPLIQELQQLGTKNDDNFSILVEILKDTKEKLIAGAANAARNANCYWWLCLYQSRELKSDFFSQRYWWLCLYLFSSFCNLKLNWWLCLYSSLCNLKLNLACSTSLLGLKKYLILLEHTLVFCSVNSIWHGEPVHLLRYVWLQIRKQINQEDMERIRYVSLFVEYVHTRDMKTVYKQADGKKLDNRRVLVDDERGKTVPNWRPRRLGGGLGTTRIGSEEFTQKHSDCFWRSTFGGREMVGTEADPSRTRAAELSPMTYHKVSTAQRGSPIVSTSSGRRTVVLKNYETTLKVVMREVAAYFVGKHDFSSFANATHNDRLGNPVKEIFCFDIVEMGNDISSDILPRHTIATPLAASVVSSTSALSLLATQPSRQNFWPHPLRALTPSFGRSLQPREALPFSTLEFSLSFFTLASKFSCHSPPLRSPFRSPPSRSRREVRSPNFCGDSVFPASRASRRLAFSKIGAKPQPNSPPSRSRTRSQALTSSAATSSSSLVSSLMKPSYCSGDEQGKDRLVSQGKDTKSQRSRAQWEMNLRSEQRLELPNLVVDRGTEGRRESGSDEEETGCHLSSADRCREEQGGRGIGVSVVLPNRSRRGGRLPALGQSACGVGTSGVIS